MPLASVTAHWLAGWGQQPAAPSGSTQVAPRRQRRQPRRTSSPIHFRYRTRLGAVGSSTSPTDLTVNTTVTADGAPQSPVAVIAPVLVATSGTVRQRADIKLHTQVATFDWEDRVLLLAAAAMLFGDDL